MRRFVIAVGVLAVMALLVWLALSGQIDDRGPGAGEGGGGPDVEEAEDPAGAERDRRKKNAPKTARPESDRARTAFQRRHPTIGQDLDHDPERFALLVGRVLLTPGAPAGDAVVEAVRGGVPLARAHAAADGSFEMKNVPPGAGLSLVATSPGYAAGGADKLNLRIGQTLRVGSLYVGAPIDPEVDNRIEVVVEDGEGAALVDADVTMTSVIYAALIALGPFEKLPGGTVLRARTDGNGLAVFERVPPAAYDVFAELEGFALEVRQRMVMQKDTDTRVELKLAPGLSISGKVVDANGQTVAGARVGGMRWGDFTTYPATGTDEQGAFTFSGIKPGNYFLYAATDDQNFTEMRNIAAGTTDLVVTIRTGSELILKVVDATTGEPLSRFGFRPFRNVPFAYPFSPLLEVEPVDGLFTTHLPDTSFGMEISADGYRLHKEASVTLDTGEPVVVEMKPAGVVHGRVVGRSSGKVVIGAQVWVKRGGFPPTPYKDLQTVTGHDGTFVLDKLDPSTLVLRISHVDHTEEVLEGITPVVRGPDGALPAPLEFTLGEGGRIEGRVFGQDGVAMEGQVMMLSTLGFDFSATRTTIAGANGVYLFKNVPTTRTYRVSVGEFRPGGSGRSKTDVAVTEGATTTVDFGLEEGGQTVRGRIVRGEKPVGRAAVSLVSRAGAGSQQQTRSGDDGSFVFQAVQPGVYSVTVQSSGMTSIDLTVEAGAPPGPMEITLQSGGLEGQVVDGATGEGVAGAYIECEQIAEAGGSSVESISKRWRGGKASGADGRFRMGGLGGGTYRLRVYHDQFATGLYDGFVLIDGQSKTDVRLELEQGGTLTGKVSNGAGTPVEGANLRLFDDKGREMTLISMTQSSSDGRYTMGGVPAGRYTARFERDGFAPATRTLSVVVGGTTTQDFELVRGGSIRVTVRDASQTLVEDAVATLSDAAGKTVTKGLDVENLFSAAVPHTDVHGVVVLKDLGPGKYTVSVKVADGRGGQGSVEILSTGEVTLDVTIH